jgi:hypothetical protein
LSGSGLLHYALGNHTPLQWRSGSTASNVQLGLVISGGVLNIGSTVSFQSKVTIYGGTLFLHNSSVVNCNGGLTVSNGSLSTFTGYSGSFASLNIKTSVDWAGGSFGGVSRFLNIQVQGVMILTASSTRQLLTNCNMTVDFSGNDNLEWRDGNVEISAGSFLINNRMFLIIGGQVLGGGCSFFNKDPFGVVEKSMGAMSTIQCTFFNYNNVRVLSSTLLIEGVTHMLAGSTVTVEGGGVLHSAAQMSFASLATLSGSGKFHVKWFCFSEL